MRQTPGGLRVAGYALGLSRINRVDFLEVEEELAGLDFLPGDRGSIEMVPGHLAWSSGHPPRCDTWSLSQHSRVYVGVQPISNGCTL